MLQDRSNVLKEAKSMTSWTISRLQRLFLHYNRKYWKERLPDYSVLIDNVMDPHGEIFFQEKLIKINVKLHKSDSEVRATVLHEMAHLAVGKEGHNSAFFSELEKLLSLNAPIEIGFPENENRKWLHVIPTRFHLLRKKLVRPYAKQQRVIERRIKGLKAPVEKLTPERIEQLAEDAALEGLTWKLVFLVIVDDKGFVDADGKPLKWAGPYIVAAKRGYRRGRRSYLVEKDLERQFGINAPRDQKK